MNTDEERKRELMEYISTELRSLVRKNTLENIEGLKDWIISGGIVDIPFLDKLKSSVQEEIFKEDFGSYDNYIKSAAWKEKATKAKERAGWHCQLCNEAGDKSTLHAHHRTYERLGFELDGDIIALCSDCHAKFHNKEPHNG